MNTETSINRMVKENLSVALKNTGKSAKEISELTGIEYDAVKDYMMRRTFPNMIIFDKLVETLGLDESKIMRYDLVNEIIDNQIKKK